MTEDFQESGELDEDDGSNLKQPLLYMMVDQPNIYISQKQNSQKIQVRQVNIALKN